MKKKLSKAFTLIEIIFTLVILSFLIMGGFMITSKIYKRNYLVTKMSEFEFLSQQTLDQIASIIYYRVPLSVIGYDPKSGEYKYIGFVGEDESYSVIEWLGYLSDAMKERNLSGFVDLYGSDAKNYVLKCVDFNYQFVESVAKNKFNTTDSLENISAIVFAGSFDRGDEEILSDYENAFGWHGDNHKFVYSFSKDSTNGNDSYLKLTDFSGGRVYEKFYLVDSAYALARLGDLDKNNLSNCKNIDLSKFDDNTLILFFNYRPWKGETFCADSNGNPAGEAFVLAENVKAIKVKAVNAHLELKMTMEENRSLLVRVSKQKVAF